MALPSLEKIFPPNTNQWLIIKTAENSNYISDIIGEHSFNVAKNIITPQSENCSNEKCTASIINNINKLLHQAVKSDNHAYALRAKDILMQFKTDYKIEKTGYIERQIQPGGFIWFREKLYELLQAPFSNRYAYRNYITFRDIYYNNALNTFVNIAPMFVANFDAHMKQVKRNSYMAEMKEPAIGGVTIKIEDLMREIRNMCAVCLVNYNESSHITILKCGHAFHNHCIYKWSKSCPMCRHD